jgi:hypothetical protein
VSTTISMTDHYRAKEIFAKADDELTAAERDFLRRLAARWDLEHLDEEGGVSDGDRD